ncbi:hypothetical protein FY036_06890 [Mesorhizobium microcysteis]|uniref:Uncharacterized protein n=1 Tax=Neoaquamicrobium microcysteis TaxID=2682781 RepID=A0A5D4GZE8_9HYPH|nr:hypothetical protein [Mesorhizobium microcysteis]TYR33768.1 hypothetical protein FY036_06890 [Mesorhizobium microcysteis]
MHDFNDNHGHMGLPNPMDPSSGWTVRSSAPDYSRAEVPDTAPAGMVFVPGLNTYVAEDVAASLGLGPSNAVPQEHPAAMQALDPRGVPAGTDPAAHAAEDQLDEISDEDLEALKDQLEIQDVEPSLSETADDIAACFTPEDFKDGVTTLVATGDPQDAVARIVEAYRP